MNSPEAPGEAGADAADGSLGLTGLGSVSSPPGASLPALLGELPGRKIDVFAALKQRDDASGKKLAAWYLAGHEIMQDAGRLDGVATAAHEIREVIENLYKYFDVPVERSAPDMGKFVADLTAQWDQVAPDYMDKGVLQLEGTISKDLGGMLGFMHTQLALLGSRPWGAKAKVTAFVKGADPSSAAVPAVVRDRKVKEWLKLRSYFTSAAHHGDSTIEELERLTARFDDLLLSELAPAVFEEFAVLDELIAEVESDA